MGRFGERFVPSFPVHLSTGLPLGPLGRWAAARRVVAWSSAYGTCWAMLRRSCSAASRRWSMSSSGMFFSVNDGVRSCVGLRWATPARPTYHREAEHVQSRLPLSPRRKGSVRVPIRLQAHRSLFPRLWPNVGRDPRVSSASCNHARQHLGRVLVIEVFENEAGGRSRLTVGKSASPEVFVDCRSADPPPLQAWVVEEPGNKEQAGCAAAKCWRKRSTCRVPRQET